MFTENKHISIKYYRLSVCVSIKDDIRAGVCVFLNDEKSKA